MAKPQKRKLTAEKLTKMKVPRSLIPGLLMAAALGWMGWNKLGPGFWTNSQVFPGAVVVDRAVDGDTMLLKNGLTVRLLGVDAKPVGDPVGDKGLRELGKLVEGKSVWLEYDRYLDDKFGRALAWVWINCEKEPEFLPPDYMYLNASESRDGLTDNPKGCSKGKLVQEELIKKGVVWLQVYVDRGELKYQKRLGWRKS